MTISNVLFNNREISNNIKTLRDLRVTSSALVSKKKLKTNILLEVIDDIINEYPNTNYVRYERKRDKDKILSVKEYLNMIKPCLSDMINDHKTQGKWKFHSGNTIIDDNTQTEWKIQLTVTINFVSSEDFDEICTTFTKSDNIYIYYDG